MTYHLEADSIRTAIRHLSRYGDTDIFPHLAELAFLADEEDAVVDEISKLDLDIYQPIGAVEALAPKSRLGFRIAHQLPFVDTLLFCACVVSIGEVIENKRQGASGARAFSYRFKKDNSGHIFRQDRTYKDWLVRQGAMIEQERAIRQVVVTDITDFYARINFHRLENLLDEIAPGNGSSKFIKKHIKTIRAKQSFGLPVGGSAARVLAEMALIDTDQALRDQGIKATRFVDDFRLLLTAEQPAYDAIAFLAEHLGINEGLSLNNAKTATYRRRDFTKRLTDMTSDVSDEAEGVALDTLTADLYFQDDEPNPDDLEKLKGLNLVSMLQKEISRDNWDMGRIKVLFRALKLSRPPEAISFIRTNFSSLLIFAKELCLLMETLEEESPKCFVSLHKEVLTSLLSSPASSVQLIRTWLIELYVRGIIEIPLKDVAKIEALGSVLDKRQALFIRGRLNDKNYFRRKKTAVHTFSSLELPALVWGASCLPSDEYETWTASIKNNYKTPLIALFIKWAVQHKGQLTDKLKAKSADHPE